MFLLSAFTIGLFGSLHCLGMCGPLMLVAQQGRDKQKLLLETLLYQSGRILTYALLGFLFGSLGWGVYLFGMQQELAIVTGIFILATALLQIDLETPLKHFHLLNRFRSTLSFSFGKRLNSGNSQSRFLLGVVNGLLPCGLVYLAILGAVNAGTPLLGACYMLAFGMGTLPLLLSSLYLGYRFLPKVKAHIKLLTVFILVLTAALLIWRGMHYAVPIEFWSFQDQAFPPMCH